MRIGFISGAVLVLLALLACHTWYGPDLWFHIAWGRAIWQQGELLPAMPVLMRWPMPANPYWLFQLTVNAVYALGGPALITFFFAGLWLLIAYLWLQLLNCRHRHAVVGILFLFFVFCVELRLEFRPETFSFLYLSLLLYGLMRPLTKWSIAGLFVIEVLWVNSHSYFICAPFLAGLRLLCVRGERRASAVLLALVSAATLCNPQGAAVWANAWKTYELLRDLNANLEELTPTYVYTWWVWPMPLYWTMFGLTMAVGLNDLRVRRNIFAALIGVAGVLVSLRCIRFVPIGWIMAAPVLGLAIGRLRVAPLFERWARLGLGVAICGLCLAVVSGSFHRWIDSGTRFGVGVDWAEYPVGAAAFLHARDFKGRLFNEPTDGGYLLYHLPAATVTCDSGYTESASAKAYFKAGSDPEAFANLDGQLKFDAALVSIGKLDLVRALLTSPDWTVAYSDSHRILFVKKSTMPGAWARPLATDPHYHGEDLRRWGYREAPELWMRLAILTRDSALAQALVREFAPAENVPIGFVKSAYAYALLSGDRGIEPQLKMLRAHMFGAADAELTAMEERALGSS